MGGRDRIRHALHAQRAVLGYCDVVWDKKTIDVKEEMAGSFSVTIRCSFVGGDHQWVVTELYAQRLCFERSSMGRVRGCGRVGSLAFHSVPSGVLSLTIRNHWFLGKRDH